MKSAVAATAVVVSLLLLTVGAAVVLGQMKDVSGTGHDVASPHVSPCVYCHLPRDLEREVLWADDPSSSGELSGLRSICFSCHDGTVAATGSYVFDATRPQHLSNPGLRNQDCDRCHDPHDTSYGNFIKLPDAANFCQNCHSSAGPMDHPINVDARAAGMEPEDARWDPKEDDFSGTRLWNIEGSSPGDYMKCLTCHSPHGAEPDTAINTVAFESTHESFLPICQNCHYGAGND